MAKVDGYGDSPWPDEWICKWFDLEAYRSKSRHSSVQIVCNVGHTGGERPNACLMRESGFTLSCEDVDKAGAVSAPNGSPTTQRRLGCAVGSRDSRFGVRVHNCMYIPRFMQQVFESLTPL